MKNCPSVSIIFPNHNGGTEPLDCLLSIKRLNYPKENIEIIVIDNNSTDGSEKEIKKKNPSVKLYKMAKNIGFAKAINFGIQKSSGDYIFIGNDDLVFEKNSIKEMIKYMFSHPKVGIVGGKIFYKYNPSKIASAGYLMNKWTGNVYSAPYPDQIKEPDWCQGCALLVHKTLLKQIAFLDPYFNFFFEDYDLCLRIRNQGYKITYLPTAIFWHSESFTSSKNKPFKYFNWYKNKFRFLIKNFPLINIFSIFLFQTFLIVPYRGLILRDGRAIPFFKGIFWNIKNFNQTLKERKKHVKLRL